MGLFSKKRAELPPLLTDDEIELGSDDAVNFNTVLDYLVDLSQDDYERIKKVANIYRNAHKDAAKVIGIDYEPTATIAKEQKPDPDFLEPDEGDE